MHGLPLLQIVAIAILILANGFFVAAEFALVSIRDTRIEQMIAAGVPGANSVRRLQRDLDGFLPALIIYPAKRNEQEQRWNGESDSRRSRGDRGRPGFLVHGSN